MSIEDAKKLIDTEKSIRLANLEVEVDIVKMDIIFNKYKAFCDGVYQAYQVANGMTPHRFTGLDDGKGVLELHTYIRCSCVEFLKKATKLQIERKL